jgi:putative FmdB family regulatory protein
MAIYEFEHEGKACKLGKVFEWELSMKDEPLKHCPACGGAVRKIISAPGLSFPRSDSDLKGQGFTKLVRREKGVYENVTAREGESRVVKLGDQSTYPLKARRKK